MYFTRAKNFSVAFEITMFGGEKECVMGPGCYLDCLKCILKHPNHQLNHLNPLSVPGPLFDEASSGVPGAKPDEDPLGVPVEKSDEASSNVPVEKSDETKKGLVIPVWVMKRDYPSETDENPMTPFILNGVETAPRLVRQKAGGTTAEGESFL